MSTRKRMSLRAIAQMKRENRELRARLSAATRREQATTLSTWTIGQRMIDEITTARRLGFGVEASAGAETVTLTAVKRVNA